MKLFDPWQDTISILSGAKVRRTPRPGEHFIQPEQLRRSVSVRERLVLYVNRFRFRIGKSRNRASQVEVRVVPEVTWSEE